MFLEGTRQSSPSKSAPKAFGDLTQLKPMLNINCEGSLTNEESMEVEV